MRVSLLALVLLSGSPRAEEALPTGLLEFLGAMVESNGELVDPLNLTIDAIDGGSDEALEADEDAAIARRGRSQPQPEPEDR